jgi:Tfp pilus assembly PilM family ATPase
VVGKRVHEDHLDVVVSVVPKQVVDMYVDIFTSAGMTLASLEVESQSVARAVISRENKKACLITNFCSDKIGMYVVYKGIVHFTSTIAMTPDMYTNPEYITREVQKVIAFWQSNKSPVASTYPIAEVYVCGEHIDESIISICASRLAVPVYKANVWVNAFDIHTTIPQISFIDSLAYATAVGLALPPHSLVYV